MWLFFLGLTLLTGDVLSQGFQRFPTSALRPISPIAGFHNRPQVVHNAPVRADSGSFGIGLPATALSSSGSGNPCSPSPCGPNTRCDVNARGIALCRCIEGYVPDGNTIQGCKPQCVTDSECPDDYQCSANKCRRVCTRGSCGLHADCTARNHVAQCTCPPGYRGNARVSCVISQPEIRQPPAPAHFDPCIPSPCGSFTDCRARGDTPVCSCQRGYEGNPLTGCQKSECTQHSHCASHLACQNSRCIDPCTTGVCGVGANCVTRNNQPVCSCARNFIGDPFTSCRRVTEFDVCNPTPCGDNTNCRAKTEPSGGYRAVCSCVGNYIGSPLTGCRPECVTDNECSFDQHCKDNRCRNPCIDGCGEGAYCDARNHRAQCTCPQFFLGDARNRCYAECTSHEECSNHQACKDFRCINPCDGACGTGADCKVENHTPICSCPRGFTGDPFVSCRRFTLEDLCRNNPCGENAECQPGKDRENNDRPVCTCPRGYIGNPLLSCQRGECETHDQCGDTEACYAYTCQSPCYSPAGYVCGENAECNVKNHQPVCSCPRGYQGNPLQACNLRQGARIVGGRSHRQQ